MIEELNQIISYGNSIAESVNTELLMAHTKKVDAGYLNKIQWNKIQQLHILGCENHLISKKATDPDLRLAGYHLSEDQSWLLVVGAPRRRIMDYVSRCTVNLKELTVRFTSVRTLDVGSLTSLWTLDLSNNERFGQLDGLERLHHLKNLMLINTFMGPQLVLDNHPELNNLQISFSKISHIIVQQPLSHLQSFGASRCPIEDTAFLHQMPVLRSLSLSGTFLTDSAHIIFPPLLQILTLGYTGLSRIPGSIRNLKRLQYLDLSNMCLDEFPDWLPDWVSENPRVSIRLLDTTVSGLDTSVFNRSWPVIRQWLLERRNIETGKALNELKVVFLGDGGAGKSYTIARLLADGGQPDKFDGDATPGIVITDKEYDIGGRKVQIHFWDFGGQEILHSMHRMFLTDRTLYVVVLNVRDGTQDERARYWLHNIKSFAPKAPVLVVLNQMDENPNASINENDLRRMAPGMTETVKMSALEYTQEEFNAAFTAALLRQIGHMSETLDFFFPATWNKVKRNLQTMDSHYIHGRDYADICETCGVKQDNELRKALLQWFNDLGVSFCYSGDARLEDYVILRPDWLTNAIYIILFNKLENVHNGIVLLQTIYKTLGPEPDDRDRIRRVLPNVFYEQAEVSYVLNVVRRFRLSFQIDDKSEFIPMLCDRNSLPVAAEYEEDPNTLEFRMEYEYLPNNVLHRLMVELRGHLDTDNVWLTGARFEQKSTGLSAVVKTEGNVLKIFVRSTKSMHKANTYLSIIKDAVDQINQDMGLAAPTNWVVYKADGISEEFDYDDLLNALEDGDTDYRSRLRRKKIPIEDILNQTGHVADEAREKLIRDILAACRKMQSNRYYWTLPEDAAHSKEDIRNTYIRDLLSTQYVVRDQSFSGTSSGGVKAGELDLDIRLEQDVPWTIYEALNITGISDKSKWNAHLQKLLDNYNPMGLPYLFLVSYLECSRDNFLQIAEAYNEHMRWHDPKNYERSPSSFSRLSVDHGQFISTAKCTYDRGGIPTTVYHICVRLGF